MSGPVPGRAAAVDGLRAAAALAVVGYHAWLYTLPHVSAGERATMADRVLHELRLGLVLFFVLSGFLLFGPWARAALAGAPAPRPGAYLLRRAARIVPGYYLAVAGSVALLWAVRGAPGVRLPPAGELWMFAAFTQNLSDATALTLDPPLWTLAVEVSFYLVLPVLGLLGLRLRGAGRRGQLVVPLALLALGIAYNRAIFAPGPSALWPTKVLPAMAPYFAAGMLAAVLAEGRSASRRMMRVLIAAGALVVLGDGAWAAHEATLGSHGATLHTLRDLPAAAGFACIIAVVARARVPPRALGSPFAAWLGRVSYGVYLWHVPLLLFLRAHGALPLSPIPAFLVVLAPTLAIASASWYLVERPLQARARRATRSRRGGATGRAVRPKRA